MPLSEFLRMARGKLESSHQKPAPVDRSSRSENEIVELVWGNGQVMTQGQPSRFARSPVLNNSSSNVSRVRDANAARYGKFGVVESILNDMNPVVPSREMDLSQDDEMVPWLSYPIDDSLGQDYVTEILPQISGVTANELSALNSFVSVDKRSNCENVVSNLQSGAANLKVSSSSSSKDRLFGSWLPQHRQASDALGSGVTEIVSNNASNHMDAVFRNPAQSRDTVNGSNSMVMERQDIPPPTSNSNFLNFSHFSRPAKLAKENLPSSDGILKSVSSVVERNEITETSSAANRSNPVKSVHIEQLSSIPKAIESDGSGILHKVKSREAVAKAAQGLCPSEKIENLCQKTSIKKDEPLIQSNNRAPEGDRNSEPMVASSSVGSGNSTDRVSCEQTQHSKRKFRDIEESECRSDDLETESIDAKKGMGLRGSKRTRAAEVHNLSERRRRDRINEKMRALQELIPNCNKADKASMLDEAIEYLKTLQLQVQIMSMGSGLCMPPMMFPMGMQHMHPHFHPMGVGMGMAFGMGMPEMNGGSSDWPIYPVPPMQVPHFPSPMPGLPNFQRPNLPVFGHPGQAFPSSVPRPPFVHLAPRPPVNSALGSSALRNGSSSEMPSTCQIKNSGDPVTTLNSLSVCNVEPSSSVNNRSNQLQPTKEVQNQENKKATDSVARPSATATDINKEPGCDKQHI